jgi:gliding motility-associated-like protein
LQYPRQGFSFSPNPAEENKPTNFNNFSVGAVTYYGILETGKHLLRIIHLTSLTLRELTMFACRLPMPQACTDTFCLDVSAVVVPLLDVPKAFTPGRFGQNGVIKVVGFGIGKMDWRIYNRWGQRVFMSTNYLDGWDGTFNGALQPMDVYTYTLDVEFTDGKKVKKAGDISLLR